MSLLFIDGATVRRHAPVADLIDWMGEAMIAVSAGEADLPLRWPMKLPEDYGAVGIMPGYLGGEIASAGIKLISLAPVHRRKGSSHLGLMVLYDADGLQPVAILCGATITAIRTAAMSALATKTLARKSAQSLAILGAGEQAESHLEALMSARAFNDIRIWARNPDKASSFVEKHQDQFKDQMTPAPSVDQAIAGADVICAVTSAQEPILFGDMLEPGMHVNLVGSSTSESAEADIELVKRSSFFIDFRLSALNQAGELLNAIKAGLVTENHIRGEIGAVLAGDVAGRRTDDEITVYKSLGVAAQDIITARYVYERVKKQGLGVSVSL